MKKSFKQMHLILQEMRMIKGEITQQQPIKEIWIDNIEVQSSLHVSESTLYRYRRIGKIPFSRIRGKIYYKKSDIRELLENNYQVMKPKCACCCK